MASPSKKKKTAPAFSVSQAATRIRWIGSLVILFLWALLYLPHLRTSPSWYGDEFVSLIAGRSMLEGTFDNRALRYSFFSVFTNYQPFSSFLYAVFAKLFSGGDIWGARFLSTLFALGVAQTCFHVFFTRGRLLLGASAALIFLSAPQAIIHFRWVYPHLFLGLGCLVTALLLDMRRTARRDWYIGLACALCAGAHLLAAHATAIALLVRIRQPRSWLRIGIPPALMIGSALLLGYIISGQQLFTDLSEVAHTYSTHPSPPQLINKVQLYFTFFTWDWFHVFALAGLFAAALLRRWAFVAYTILISYAIIQNRPELTTFYYQASVFLPLLAVCQAYGLKFVVRVICQRFAWLQSKRWTLRVLVLAASCVFLPAGLKNSWSGNLIPRCKDYVSPSITDLEDAAKWINTHTQPTDLVISYWDVGYLLKCRWTDILQASVWEYGKCPAFYMRDRARTEFIYPADIRTARYILVSPLDLRFAYGQGTAPELIKKVNLEQWPVVWRSKTTGTQDKGPISTVILENPKLRGTPSPPRVRE